LLVLGIARTGRTRPALASSFPAKSASPPILRGPHRIFGERHKNYGRYSLFSCEYEYIDSGALLVTWVITIATFLATIVAFAILLGLYFHHKGLRDALTKTPQPRLETRAPARLTLGLSSLEGPSIHEVAFTKNVSHHGLCALTKKRWVPQNNVQVTFYEDMRAPARVVYCKRLGDAFMVGLQFSTPINLTYSAN
jgi:PilZ domain